MKISIVTITCRANGRLAEMARCLAASAAKAKDLELQWLVVDELADKRDDMLEVSNAFGCGNENASLDIKGRELIHFAPPATPHRTGENLAVAHNTARNAGLARATGDYVVFLNDCNMVTADWANVARDVALAGHGWKVKMQLLVDMKVPDDGLIHKGHHDRLRPVPILSAASACWGAPREAFEKVHGFDLAYDGERYGNDLDAIVRLSRIGITFVTTERAYTFQLRRTKIDKEITTRKDVYAGARNKRLFSQLKSDRDRILPVWEFGQPEPEALVAAAPVSVPRAPRAAPPPRVTQCPPARANAAPPPQRHPRVAQAAATPAGPRPVATNVRTGTTRLVRSAPKGLSPNRFQCPDLCEGAVVAATEDGTCASCGGDVDVYENGKLIAGPSFEAATSGTPAPSSSSANGAREGIVEFDMPDDGLGDLEGVLD